VIPRRKQVWRVRLKSVRQLQTSYTALLQKATLLASTNRNSPTCELDPLVLFCRRLSCVDGSLYDSWRHFLRPILICCAPAGSASAPEEARGPRARQRLSGFLPCCPSFSPTRCHSQSLTADAYLKFLYPSLEGGCFCGILAFARACVRATVRPHRPVRYELVWEERGVRE